MNALAIFGLTAFDSIEIINIEYDANDSVVFRWNHGGYSLIVNGRSVMVIYDKTKIYDMVAAFLQGAYFMAEKETLNYC